MKHLITLAALAFSFTAFAGNDHEHPPVKVSPAFEGMKALVGTWEGKTKMNGQDMDLKVTYELTSGGTAIIQKMNPGTPMEMITVYANSGKTVNATHFCALGNQPQMKLKNAKNGTFTFEMAGNHGISNKKEMHMRGVTITVDGNKLTEAWTNYNEGKKAGVHTFEMTKKL